MNQTTDQAVSLDYYHWAITTMKPCKLQVVCLTYSYHIKLKFPININYVPDAYEAYTNTLFLPTRTSLSKEIVLENQKINAVILTWITQIYLILPWLET